MMPHNRESEPMTKRKEKKLSEAQLYVLDQASRYTLRRSSAGWWAVDVNGEPPGKTGPTDPVVIMHPNTIESLLRLELLKEVEPYMYSAGNLVRQVRAKVPVFWTL